MLLYKKLLLLTFGTTYVCDSVSECLNRHGHYRHCKTQS